MTNSDKYVFFDFCETLVNFQTADMFVDFVCEHKRTIRTKVLRCIFHILKQIRFFRLIESFTAHRYSISKRFKLFQLRGFNQAYLEKMAYQFYIEKIRPNFIPQVLELLCTYRQKGYKIGLVSGAYNIYLIHFVSEYGLDFCICSKLSFRKGVCTGLLDGKDCMRNQKVEQLNLEFHTMPDESVAFSDNVNDLPFLMWAKKGVVVSKGEHQDWIDNYNFKEIIWE